MNLMMPASRALFAAIFLMAGPSHFSPELVSYAASRGVPAPWFLVPASGVLASLGALCLILGWRARLGAWMIVAFLVPVTFAIHRFWGLADPAEAMRQAPHFWKNISMLGGALAFAHFGAGPYSLDGRRGARRARLEQAPERVPTA